MEQSFPSQPALELFENLLAKMFYQASAQIPG
jgi:hypothetical protein